MSRKPPDFDLWLDIAKSVKPLRHFVSKPQPVKSHPPAQADPHKPLTSVSAPRVHLPASQYTSPPQLTGLDRRTTQRLTRGQVEIDLKLDLHGSGIEMARMRLMQFLRIAQADGARTVLVVTGKGDSLYSRHTLHGADYFHSPDRQGRLRRLVPEWFHEAEFRSLVSGFQPAHPKHGGGGAFYVKIRRPRQRG